MLGAPLTAGAQDTREAALEQIRSEKAAALSESTPKKLEKWMLWVEDAKPFEKLAPHDGFYLQYGFKWKPTGGGLGVGGGWRHDLFNRNARLVLGAGISTRNYQMLQADFSLPYLLRNRLEIGGHAVYRHNPQEDFWGVGGDSLKDNRVSYKVDYRNYEGRAIVRPVPWLQVGTRCGRLDGTIGRGTDSRFPRLKTSSPTRTLPAWRSSPITATPRSSPWSIIATRTTTPAPAATTRSPGASIPTSTSISTASAPSISLLQQFFPIFDKKRVFAVQGRAAVGRSRRGRRPEVPFYFKPTLGGSTSHRGYNDYRFRDDAVIYFNAEYRWEAFSGLDMALFDDWGTVAPNIDGLKLTD